LDLLESKTDKRLVPAHQISTGDVNDVDDDKRIFCKTFFLRMTHIDEMRYEILNFCGFFYGAECAAGYFTPISAFKFKRASFVVEQNHFQFTAATMTAATATTRL